MLLKLYCVRHKQQPPGLNNKAMVALIAVVPVASTRGLFQNVQLCRRNKRVYSLHKKRVLPPCIVSPFNSAGGELPFMTHPSGYRQGFELEPCPL